MVSQTLPRDAEAPHLRRMDPSHDLAGVARVIEVAFADELTPGGHVVMRELRLLNALGPLLWVVVRALPSLRDLFGGFVWEADGQVVGNVTLTRAEGSGRQWIISNVAVLPAYRRQGVARALVEASIEHARGRGAALIMLQVRHDNAGAKRLYEQMNFRYLETVTELLCQYVRPSALPQPPDVAVRAPDAKRWYEAYDVARAAVPRVVQEMRPLRPQSFRIRERSPLERLWDSLVGPARERWWAEQGGRVMGLLTIERQMNRTGEQVELLIHPHGQGQVEAALVNQLTARLRGHHDVRLTLASHLADGRALLREAGFRELRTLDQMVLEL